MRCCTVCRCCSTCNPVAVYPPCTSAMLRTLQHRQPGMCVLRLGSAPYGCVSASSVSSRMRCAHPGQQASLSTRDFSKSDTRQSACSPTLTGGRHLASFAEDSGSDASAAHSGIRYLERWAGIHGGRTKSEVEGRHGSPPSPSPRSSSAPSQPQPIVHTVGRTYLVPTIRIPPFPPSSEGVEEEGERGVVDDATLVIREERRVFEWMTGMLQLGNGALGATVATPVAGSPVVLDLGAVSQDGSPHARPAGRASLAGATRAVKAAGFIPVGVCNTSQDVLNLAADQGLPEVMMVQARPRTPAPVTARRITSADVKRSSRRNPQCSEGSPDCSEEHYSDRSEPQEGSPADRPSSLSASRSSCTAENSQNVAVQDRSIDTPNDTLKANPVATTTPVNGAENTSRPKARDALSSSLEADENVPVAAANATTNENPASSKSTDAPLASPGKLEGAKEGGFDDLPRRTEEGEDGVVGRSPVGYRETLVFSGSVRSGQQVYAEGTSLVVIGAVRSGGEVMADGDIHVYGHLRGRALAGLAGNSSAKIFSTRFDAELVGIADTFTTCHDPESLPGVVIGAPTNVGLGEGGLVFRSFDISAPSIKQIKRT